MCLSTLSDRQTHTHIFKHFRFFWPFLLPFSKTENKDSFYIFLIGHDALFLAHNYESSYYTGLSDILTNMTYLEEKTQQQHNNDHKLLCALNNAFIDSAL